MGSIQWSRQHPEVDRRYFVNTEEGAAYQRTFLLHGTWNVIQGVVSAHVGGPCTLEHRDGDLPDPYFYRVSNLDLGEGDAEALLKKLEEALREAFLPGAGSFELTEQGGILLVRLTLQEGGR